MKHRFGTALTAVLLLAACGLASCGEASAPTEKGNTPSAETAGETAAVTESETEAKPASVVPDGLDFGGKTFMLLGGDAVFEVYTMATELSGDTLNDALFNRYQAVGDKLNVSFAFTPENSTGAVSKLTSSVLAGDDSYQLAIVQRATSIAKMVGDHLLHNWNDLPYVDLTTPYWFHDAIESLRVGDLIYYTYGDIYPMSTHVMYYNKAMLDTFDLPSPHEYALNGTWTLDRLLEMASAVSKDLNGDGKMDENDQYGISFGNTDMINSLMYGAGVTITEKNGDGVTLRPLDDRMLAAYEKIHQLFQNNTCYFKKLNTLTIATGQVLFYTSSVHGARTYRDSTVEFGLLPYPKFDEAQEHYISFLNTELMCVPSTADPELAGACTQLLAENSGGVKEAYYEYLLKEKVARDPESAQVLDLIFGNAINDFIISYCGGMSKSSNMYNIPQTLAQKGSTDFASSYEKNAEGVMKEIEKAYGMILSNTEG